MEASKREFRFLSVLPEGMSHLLFTIQRPQGTGIGDRKLGGRSPTRVAESGGAFP